MIAEKQKTIDQILVEFKASKNKTALIKHIAVKFNRSAQGIKNNWFYGFGCIPTELVDDVLAEVTQWNLDHE